MPLETKVGGGGISDFGKLVPNKEGSYCIKSTRRHPRCAVSTISIANHRVLMQYYVVPTSETKLEKHKGASKRLWTGSLKLVLILQLRHKETLEGT